MPILICQQCGRMFEVTPSLRAFGKVLLEGVPDCRHPEKRGQVRMLRKGVQSPQPQEPAFLLPHLCQRSAKRLEPGSVSRKKSAAKADPRKGKHLCAGVAGKSCGRWITDYRCPQCWEKLRKGSDAEGLPSYEFHGRRSGGMEWDW